jgi:hypothetical protein
MSVVALKAATIATFINTQAAQAAIIELPAPAHNSC